jgi:hypothetical protein
MAMLVMQAWLRATVHTYKNAVALQVDGLLQHPC